MSTRPAEITTPYGWAELFDAIRATREAIQWINDRIDHYQDLRAGQQPTESTEPDEAAEANRRQPDISVDDRGQQRSEPADSPAAEPGSDAGNDTEPEKGSDAMQPDEQRRRDDLVMEEHERQQRDLQSDGVLDGDYDPEPGDGGTTDPDLDLES
ncbi:hypothetical protein AB0H83_29765 [Dactylosporangium sp. NPDC050688]|uniref:hypothetical protein n=1 Tax=Dactylosporangium sp. NPDC050688 TaxID=3157217 RepID=UPI0034092A4E